MEFRVLCSCLDINLIRARIHYPVMPATKPNMAPPTGDVTYNILIDGRMRIDLNEKLTHNVLKVIKLDCKCSTIRVTTTNSPSWIDWDNIWPRRNGYYG